MATGRSRAIRSTAVLALLVLTAFHAREAAAAGPWRGRVVDAQTGQPLEGVVVLAFWTRSWPSLGGWAAAEYQDSEEVVTGPDGRFVIRPRRSYTVPLVTKVQGPDWRIFKSGYGEWPWLTDPEQGEQFERGVETVIALPPVATRDERLSVLRADVPPTIVPVENARRLLEAVNAERVELGLQRIRQ